MSTCDYKGEITQVNRNKKTKILFFNILVKFISGVDGTGFAGPKNDICPVLDPQRIKVATSFSTYRVYKVRLRNVSLGLTE